MLKVLNTLCMRLKVGICEDDSFTRSTLSAALAFADVEVSFSASDATSAILEAEQNMPHAVVLDLHLGTGPNGVDLARSLRRLAPEIGIVFLTSFETPRLLEKNLNGLPSGSQYLTKRNIESVSQILDAIQKSIAKGRKTTLPNQGQVDTLTNHQLQVLELIAQGLSNGEIATKLGVELKSIQAVTSRISKKLGLESYQSINQRIQMAKAYLRATGNPYED
jgi:DNA-binding NarL/FixJ family response regulator